MFCWAHLHLKSNFVNRYAKLCSLKLFKVSIFIIHCNYTLHGFHPNLFQHWSMINCLILKTDVEIYILFFVWRLFIHHLQYIVVMSYIESINRSSLGINFYNFAITFYNLTEYFLNDFDRINKIGQCAI